MFEQPDLRAERTDAARRPPARPPATATVAALFDGRTDDAAGTSKHDPTSLAALDVAPTVDGAELRLRYGLGRRRAGQFAALVVDTPGGVARRSADVHRREPSIRCASRVQLRAPAPTRRGALAALGLRRRRRSGSARCYFDDLHADRATETVEPPLEQIHSILFVVDTTNTKPGSRDGSGSGTRRCRDRSARDRG